MKLNQKFIKQLRNGEIAVGNNGTEGQLREVLKDAFPNGRNPTGDCRFYFMSSVYTNKWDANYSYTNLPVVSVADFYEPELFTGWANHDNHPKWMGHFKNGVAKFGFDASGVWKGGYTYEDYYSEDEGNRPATHEEIEERLTEEAKRRGYKGGNTIKGIHGTTHWNPEIGYFYYDPESDSLVTDIECVVYEKGQWAEIVDKPQPKPKPQPKKQTTINYLVDGMEYSFNYQELKAKYQAVVNYSDEQFMDNLPEIAHLACIISYFKGLSNNATIGDKGIVHEIIHLMTEPNEPTNDLQEIREKFNRLIQLV